MSGNALIKPNALQVLLFPEQFGGIHVAVTAAP
jgi:hypothetical protein